MMRIRFFFAALSILSLPLTAAGQSPSISDAALKQDLIRQSREAYSGNCPCPYDTMRNGRRCGQHSAYSKPGGASPVCYERDVTEDMLRRHRERLSRLLGSPFS